jgi:Mce-associated membrane protein
MMEAVDTADTPAGTEVDQDAPGPALADVEPAEDAGSGTMQAFDADSDEPEASPSEPRSRRWVPWLVAAALALACLVSLLVAADAQSDARSERDDREAVLEAASRLTTAMVTYDYRDFDATKKRVFELSTGVFRQQYEEGAGSVAESVRLAQGTSEGVVRDVFLSEIDDGRARAVVHFDIRGSGIGGTRDQIGNFIDLSLVKVEGRWLVDGVQHLNFPLGQTVPNGAAPPTSTP